MELKRNLRVFLREMELRWMVLGKRRAKRMRIKNVKVTANMKIRVCKVVSDGLRSPSRECLSFTMTVLQDE